RALLARCLEEDRSLTAAARANANRPHGMRNSGGRSAVRTLNSRPAALADVLREVGIKLLLQVFAANRLAILVEQHPATGFRPDLDLANGFASLRVQEHNGGGGDALNLQAGVSELILDRQLHDAVVLLVLPTGGAICHRRHSQKSEQEKLNPSI